MCVVSFTFFNMPADLKILKLINISTLFLNKTGKFEHLRFQLLCSNYFTWYYSLLCSLPPYFYEPQIKHFHDYSFTYLMFTYVTCIFTSFFIHYYFLYLTLRLWA